MDIVKGILLINQKIANGSGLRYNPIILGRPESFPAKTPQRLTKRTNQDPRYGNVLWVFLSNAMLSGRETYRQAFAAKNSGGTSNAGSIFMLLQSLIPRMDSPDAAIKKPPMSVTSVIRASVKYGAIVPANR